MTDLTSVDILQLTSLPEPAATQLAETFRLHDARDASRRDEVIAQQGHRIRGVLTGAFDKIPAEMLARLPKLEIIASRAAGVDSIDVATAHARRIVVTNGSLALADDVADLAIGLMFCVARDMVAADNFVRSGGWEAGTEQPGGSNDKPAVVRVSGKRLGIVGLGTIGETVARRAAAMNMAIAYTQRRQRHEVPYEFVPSVRDLAERSDFLVLACAGGAETRHLIDTAVLSALGGEGFLINIARGSVVYETALIEALRTGTIRGAGLDVFESEPRVPEGLRRLPNVVLSPHSGTRTRECKTAQGDLVVDNLIAQFSGGTVRSVVRESAASSPGTKRT